MKNTFGNNLSVTLFGESHGNAIGVVIDGISPGICVDTDFINKILLLRRPAGVISTARREQDEFVIESGVFNGKTTGTPICVIIPNIDTRSSDYAGERWLARPSHADYTAYSKYHGFEDYRCGGHFSGRITAALCVAGAIVLPALNKKGIRIGTHIKKCAGVYDRDFSQDIDELNVELDALYSKNIAVLDNDAGEKITAAISKAKSCGNSVGGILETVITGVDAGLGEPWFDTVEGLLSHALFSIPAIKGVEFGAGFGFADMKGSEANDAFFSNCGEVYTKTNNNGGINGGITNGMPIVFKCAVKPTPTLAIEQNTINMETKEQAVLLSRGRHDPCIVHRARIVVDCIAAFTLADILAGRYGTDWLAK